jgi:Uma2 family endonuclease
MTVTKYKLNSAQYHLMAEIGIFNHDKRLELIEGEITEMSPIGFKHALCVSKLDRLLQRSLPVNLFIWVQNSIRLSDGSEPQPDLAILREAELIASEQRLPIASDILLVIEVADSTIDYDRDVKMPLYAKFGIPEAWLIDVNGEMLTRYTMPSSKGYKSVQILDKSESVVCLGIEMAIANFLGE